VTTFRLVIAAILILNGDAAIAQPPALRVVVIEGEDGVNIIQQKTAVRPIVEVRDRNNLPVSGALVTFSIEGGKAATFGGASTLTVATNAAGQAAVTGLTPSAAGAFQIQVSAAFQGQVATATIAQTNVLTAAQAAAAAGANSAGASAGGTGGAGGAGGAGGGAGGAAGAGGGLSATTIAVAGAAVAGGAVAATQVVGKDKEGAGEDKFAGSFSGTLISTVTSRNNGQSCTITRSVNGTATLRLTVNTASSVSGEIELNGTDVVVSQTCNGPVSNGGFVGLAAVSGTPSSMRGSDTRTDSMPGTSGETIQSTRALLFEGTLSGNSVTGTLKVEGRSTTTGGGGGPVDGVLLGTFPVTLTKS
jgi:hypothetical protein